MASITQNEPSPGDAMPHRVRHASNGRVNVYYGRLNGELNRSAWEDSFHQAADKGFTHVCLGYAAPNGANIDFRDYLERSDHGEASVAWVTEAASRAGLGL